MADHKTKNTLVILIYYQVNTPKNLNKMQGINRNNITPSKSSPKGGNRACLCQDGKTYKKECCKGGIKNQGIGKV
tara:strand:- start:192 stop:416 length:225 start_codon:yes stop_codon:yes gene_type:complete